MEHPSGSVFESVSPLCMDYNFVAYRAMYKFCFNVEHFHIFVFIVKVYNCGQVYLNY